MLPTEQCNYWFGTLHLLWLFVYSPSRMPITQDQDQAGQTAVRVLFKLVSHIPLLVRRRSSVQINPGPLNNGYEQSSARRFSRNSSNLITVHRQPYNGSSNAPLSLCLINSPSASSLKFCLLNSRSVRNKTGDLVDYILQDCKPDIVATTESWLGQHDDAVRVELCPEGYNLLDHTRKASRGWDCLVVS